MSPDAERCPDEVALEGRRSLPRRLHHWHHRSRQVWGEPSGSNCHFGGGCMYETEVCCHCGASRVSTFAGARPEGCGLYAPMEWRLKEVRLVG